MYNHFSNITRHFIVGTWRLNVQYSGAKPIANLQRQIL
jgi:hypothetical protein